MIMEDIVASVDEFKFDIEVALMQQIGIQPLPFPGMDKSGSAICDFFISSGCHRGQLCPLRHISGDRMVVCKHWLRGLCKKGDDCEFLHQYDMEKMPECYFYNKYGQCSNKECPFLHLDAEAKIKDCAWYDRGFCKHGPNCKNRHVRRIMCVNYMCGFCPLGKKCKFSHPRHEIPMYDEHKRIMSHIICHACGEPGHKSNHCAVARRLAAEAIMRGEEPPVLEDAEPTHQPTQPKLPVPPPTYTCFMCGEKGHFIRYCPKQPHNQATAAAANQAAPQQNAANVLGQSSGLNLQVNTQSADPSAPIVPLADAAPPAAFIPFGKRPMEFVTCFKCRGKGHYANKCPFGNPQQGNKPFQQNQPPNMSNQQIPNIISQTNIAETS